MSHHNQELLGATVRVADTNGVGYVIGHVVEVSQYDLGVRIERKVKSMHRSSVNVIELADLSNVHLPNWNSVIGFRNPVCADRIVLTGKGPALAIKIVWRSLKGVIVAREISPKSSS